MIYFDNSATTKPCQEAISAMERVAKEQWGNPSSTHAVGMQAHTVLKTARDTLLSALGAPAKTVQQEQSLVFCSSGTEANNLALFGTFWAKKHTTPPRIITTDSEHPSVLEAVKRLAELGAEVVYLSTRSGAIDMEQLQQALTPQTILLSIMRVNNETGAVYDTKNAFALAKQKCPQIVTHSDCVQAFGKIPVSVRDGADLITVSAHKIHGPKGVGALYICPDVLRAKKIVAHLFGGGQEGGLRSGTQNTAGIAGFGAAVAHLHPMTQAQAVRQYLLSHLPKEVQPNLPAVCAPHILHLTLPNIKSETMLNFLSAKGICISAGSACAAHGKKQNHVLLAYGLTPAQADCSVRISLSHDATVEQADAFLEALQQGLNTLVRIKR